MQNSQGFSLTETLVVLAVIAGVLGFAVPGWQNQIIAKEVDIASGRLFRDLQLARAQIHPAGSRGCPLPFRGSCILPAGRSVAPRLDWIRRSRPEPVPGSQRSDPLRRSFNGSRHGRLETPKLDSIYARGCSVAQRAFQNLWQQPFESTRLDRVLDGPRPA